MLYLLLLTLLWWTVPVLAEDFRCAGSQDSEAALLSEGAAAKSAHIAASTTGTRRALVLFARFKGEDTALPPWAADIFNSTLPGSFSHFYDTMSFGKLQVRGEVAPQVYESAQPASAYLATPPLQNSRLGQFAYEILRQADQDLDFAQFDNDGPDGISNSGDDDGEVDAVFIVLNRVPVNFLQGEATGIRGLGISGPFRSNDKDSRGRPVSVSSSQGTIQQGRTFAETVGSMCHEYGHVLGLPDLYNTEFIGKSGVGPEEDSGGVGAWCLMGWGATGWNGDDGPNSFCAWSRVQLGWAEVAVMEQEFQEMHLPEVEQSGQVFKVPLRHDEHFLLEYRRRTGNFYDRHIPGEGLLIWHISGAGLDLECADGKWQDAGYPLGKTPDPEGGGDNLDFWAHDDEYTQAHGGNLGDATDPFDGVRFASFTPEGNPPSSSENGHLSARIEGIHFEGDTAIAQVQASPMQVSARQVTLRTEDNDGVILAGEQVQVQLVLFNEGGVPLHEVRVQLRTDDPLAEITAAVAEFGTLEIGRFTVRSAAGDSAPVAFHFTDGFAGVHTATLMLDIYAGQTLAGQYHLVVTGLSSRQAVRRVRVVDSAGNGDGQAQGGEIIRLGLELEGDLGEVKKNLSFSFRSLSTGAALIGSAGAGFDPAGELQSPEFLLSADLDPGTHLEFELLSVSRYSAWADTLTIELQPGPDQTPPRIQGLGISLVQGGVRFFLPRAQILDGSRVDTVYVEVRRRADSTAVAELPLGRQGERYVGLWAAPAPDSYLAEVVAEDVAGNVGRSGLQPFEVFALPEEGVGTFSGLWEALPFPKAEHQLANPKLVLAPGEPAAMYLSASQGVWRSVGGGRSWEGLIMKNIPLTGGLLFDPQDPRTLYISGSYPLKSRDGGWHWAPAFADLAVSLLATDPVNPLRLYGGQKGGLVISEDGGTSWKETDVQSPGIIRVHPKEPQVVYVSALSVYDPKLKRYVPGLTYLSVDGGKTWEHWTFEHAFDDLILDPQDSARMYGTSGGTLWYSANQGKAWNKVREFSLSGTPFMHLATGASGLLVAWSIGAEVLWQSQDGGFSWQELALPEAADFVALDPQDVQHLVLGSQKQGALLQTHNGGLIWERQALPQATPPAGTVVFDAAGRLVTSTARQTSEGLIGGLFASGNGGNTWEELGKNLPSNFGPVELVYTDPYDPKLIVVRTGGAFYASNSGGAEWFWGNVVPYLAFSTAYPEIVAPLQRRGVYYLAGLGVWQVSFLGEYAKSEGRSAGLPQILYLRGQYWYTPEVTGLAIDPENPATLYAAIGDSLWRTQDEGLHWEYYNQVGEGGAIYALHRNPVDTEKLYAATEGGLYLSEDEGRSWVLLTHPEIKGPRKMRLRFDTHNPRRLLWVTGTQLLSSEDYGHTWYSLGEGLTGLPWFSDAAFDPLDPAVIYAATAWGVYRLDTYQSDTAAEEEEVRPFTFVLAPNYPNPFNPTTTIRFSLPQAGEAELSIYNLLGQRVATLVKGVQGAGPQVLQWNSRDEQGRELVSGIYFYRLQAGAQVETRKLLLLR